MEETEKHQLDIVAEFLAFYQKKWLLTTLLDAPRLKKLKGFSNIFISAQGYNYMWSVRG